jgi:threonine dehydrogenase-like Zn-dependent dehydrogenase
MAVALHGVLRRPPLDGEHVLIVGAGIIGLLMAQCVRPIVSVAG